MNIICHAIVEMIETRKHIMRQNFSITGYKQNLKKNKIKT